MSKKKIVTDDVSTFHDYDLHIPTRTIYIGSCITDVDGAESGTDALMAEKVIKGLHILDNVDGEADKPINIIMNNLGGDWYHGMAIYDAIRTCKNYISITVFGYAMSMGSIILQAADERIMSENSRMMLHYGADRFAGHTLDFIGSAQEAKEMNEVMEQLYLNRIQEVQPKFTLKKLQKLIQFDKYLSAKDAVKYGLCDKIIPPSDDDE